MQHSGLTLPFPQSFFFFLTSFPQFLNYFFLSNFISSILLTGHGDDEEMRSPETLQYDLGTLRAATNNFAEENKLGKGGFGPVYKVILILQHEF